MSRGLALAAEARKQIKITGLETDLLRVPAEPYSDAIHDFGGDGGGVVLRLTIHDHETALEVRDDGRGFDPTQAFPGHLGLHSMQERIAKVGGTFAIESTPGQGTTLCVRIPVVIASE